MVICGHHRLNVKTTNIYGQSVLEVTRENFLKSPWVQGSYGLGHNTNRMLCSPLKKHFPFGNDFMYWRSTLRNHPR